MLHAPLLIPASARFWNDAARALAGAVRHGPIEMPETDLSALRVVVPAWHHAPLLKHALAAEIGGPFVAPRIVTLSGWLAAQPPAPDTALPPCEGERLMALYAELRGHPWLKKLFAVRRNTDLLPLAQTLLTLCDELTRAMLPQAGAADARWESALAQLPPPVRSLLSEESQLVWTLWKSQLDDSHPVVARFARMGAIARENDGPLVWIAAGEPDPMEAAFLDVCAAGCEVLPIRTDWRRGAVAPAFAAAWPELCDDGEDAFFDAVAAVVDAPPGLTLCPARSLEDEATCGAQTVLGWLEEGRKSIAIVAQDRVAARRTRALLERAGIRVADDTGWKLSTTRAASTIAAWFDVVHTRARAACLLDLLKSPFVLPGRAIRSQEIVAVELALRRAGVVGGWNAILGAVSVLPDAYVLLRDLADLAAGYARQKPLSGWLAATAALFDALDMRDALAADDAGRQVLAVLDALAATAGGSDAMFSFAEWRTLISMQLEATTFIPSHVDRRVAMLPLADARLRCFDAVLVLGADTTHLPSHPADTLFFANAVRRELGLATRESRQRQQLRDLAEILAAGARVVLSWQTVCRGEPNPVSPWIARLRLALRHAGAADLEERRPTLTEMRLTPQPPSPPSPRAPMLAPQRLSASAYATLLDCPYQFFATRMLRLAAADEPDELPQKRDYGDWLHTILKRYHDAVRDAGIAIADSAELLTDISSQIFGEALERHGAALGYYARWRKAMPAYLAWAAQREQDGWRYVEGEREFEKMLAWPDGSVTLVGRIDRIDLHADGQRAVLDYKARRLDDLKKKMSGGEDHQLGFYGLGSDEPFDGAHYVALEASDGRVRDLAADDYDVAQQALEQGIVACMQAIAAGAALPANGIEAICRFCDVRGLCRKGAW
ncbi:MAG: PD-(D/E)XK nuclease family protein [Burkholderiaceae bacterium]